MRPLFALVFALLALVAHGLDRLQYDRELSSEQIDMIEAQHALDRGELELARELASRRDTGRPGDWYDIESLAIARDPASSEELLRERLEGSRRFERKIAESAVIELAARIPGQAEVAQQEVAAHGLSVVSTEAIDDRLMIDWPTAALARSESHPVRRAALFARCREVQTSDRRGVCGAELPRPISMWEAAMRARGPWFGAIAFVLALFAISHRPSKLTRTVRGTRALVYASVALAIAGAGALPVVGPILLFMAAWVDAYAGRLAFVAAARAGDSVLTTRAATNEDLHLPRIEISGENESVETVVRARPAASPYREVAREERVAVIIQRRWSPFPPIAVATAIIALMATRLFVT